MPSKRKASHVEFLFTGQVCRCIHVTIYQLTSLWLCVPNALSLHPSQQGYYDSHMYKSYSSYISQCLTHQPQCCCQTTPESWFKKGHEWRTRCCFKVQTNAGGKFWMMFISKNNFGSEKAPWDVYYLNDVYSLNYQPELVGWVFSIYCGTISAVTLY